MKNTIISATLLLASIGGIVTYYDTPITTLPDMPVIGVYISETASASNVKNVLNQIRDSGKEVYVGADKNVSVEVKKELKKRTENNEGFWMAKYEDPVEKLKGLIQRATTSDFAIIKI